MASTDVKYQWVFLSTTTNRFIGINEFGKVCLSSECEGHCRFSVHGVSMPSAHLIIRLQNALNHQYFLQIDGPSPFQIDGFGGNSKQSKKSIFRYTSKVKNGQNIAMLQSVRWGFYISVKTSGEIYINQYADNRSSFYRFRVASNTPLNKNDTFNVLPIFAKNIIVKNRIQNNIDIPVIMTHIKPSAPPAPVKSGSFYPQTINPYNYNELNEEKEGMPSQLMDSASFTTLINDGMNALQIDTKNVSHTLNVNNMYDTPYNKHSILTSILTNKNMNLLPTGHITANGGNGPFSRFIIKTISNSKQCVQTDTKHMPGASVQNKSDDDIIIIQNTHLSEYLSINNLRQIDTSKKYYDISTHWKVIVKSQMLNGTKIIMLRSCLNQQLLAVNKNGIIVSVSSTSMQLKNTQFIMSNISAKNYSCFQNFMTQKFIKSIGQNIMNEIGRKINGIHIKQPYVGRTLTFEEKRFFYDFGFVIIKNAIPPNIYKAALKFINDGMSRNEHLKGFGPFGLWSCRDRAILDLYFQSNLYSMVQSLLGQSVQSLVPAAQIALRLPWSEKFKPSKKQLDGKGWHIDGMLLRNLTHIGKFSILVGIVLSEWDKEFMGNFTAYPISHNIISKLLKQNGMQSFMKTQNDIKTRYNFNKSKPKQITASIGDIILCHPFLAHRVAPNYSKKIRYGVFMRPTRMDHNKNMNVMINKNMWCEYDGLDEVIHYYNQKNKSTVTTLHQKSVSTPYIPIASNTYYNNNNNIQYQAYQQPQQHIPNYYRAQSQHQMYHQPQNIPAFNPHAYSQPIQQQYKHNKIPQINNNTKCTNTKYQKYSV